MTIFLLHAFTAKKKVTRLTAKKITRCDDFFLHAFTAKKKLHDLTAKKKLPILMKMHACRRCVHLWATSDFLPALGVPRMQGLRSTSAHFWAPRRQGEVAPSDFLPALGVGDRGYSALPPSFGPQEGRGEVATSDFLPALGVGDRGCSALPPSFGPREGRGEVATSDFLPVLGVGDRGYSALPPSLAPKKAVSFCPSCLQQCPSAMLRMAPRHTRRNQPQRVRWARMIPYEYTCNVPVVGCLGLSTLEPTKELIRHSRMKSRKPMIWCSACGGWTMKVHWHVIIMTFYFGPLR